jgi:hypothetical protein
MKKSVLSSAIMTALGVVSGGANAAGVTGLTITDVGSNTANAPGAYSSALDGISGGFRFANKYINVSSYAGTTFFTGDAGTGTVLGGGAANATGSFTTGFIFSSAPFVPYTFGNNFSADIDTANLTMNVSSLDFGGNYGGGSNFNLPPDSNYPVEVLWVVDAGGGDYNVAFRWGHDITTADDPSLTYTSFSAQWVVEGCASTVGHVGSACGGTTNPVPVPAAAWLFGSGLMGIAGVTRRRQSRKSHNS